MKSLLLMCLASASTMRIKIRSQLRTPAAKGKERWIRDNFQRNLDKANTKLREMGEIDWGRSGVYKFQVIDNPDEYTNATHLIHKPAWIAVAFATFGIANWSLHSNCWSQVLCAMHNGKRMSVEVWPEFENDPVFAFDHKMTEAYDK